MNEATIRRFADTLLFLIPDLSMDSKTIRARLSTQSLDVFVSHADPRIAGLVEIAGLLERLGGGRNEAG